MFMKILINTIKRTSALRSAFKPWTKPNSKLLAFCAYLLNSFSVKESLVAQKHSRTSISNAKLLASIARPSAKTQPLSIDISIKAYWLVLQLSKTRTRSYLMIICSIHYSYRTFSSRSKPRDSTSVRSVSCCAIALNNELFTYDPILTATLA